MKRILSLISVFALLLTACEGPQGPPGFDGFDGQDGGLIVSSAFEIELDFIAEDNIVARKLLEKTLIKAGHEIVCVENGQQALEMFRPFQQHKK